MIVRRRILLVAGLLLASAWAFAYFLWPRITIDDGPFFAEPFAADLTDLPILSSVNLRAFGATMFVLESRATLDGDARTVFVLRSRDGGVRWARVTSSWFGRIRIFEGSARWFVPGGWIVTIKPEREESGELYLSPCGGFRFFYHSW